MLITANEVYRGAKPVKLKEMCDEALKTTPSIETVIVYRRTSIEKDDSLPVDKLDANNPNLFYTFEKKFSNVNRYDNFSTQISAY